MSANVRCLYSGFWNVQLARDEVMYQLSLSWTIGMGTRCRGGAKKCPEWSDIELFLNDIQVNSGSVTITVVDGPEIGPQLLQVFSDRGNYLLMLGEDNGEEYDVRSFANLYAQPGKIEVLGYLWDAKMVCSDFNIVRRAFREFFHNKNVSHDLMN
jgi:hypothetical protein